MGNVSSKFENQMNKAIKSCFHAVKPHVVYNTSVMLPSAKKDSVPTTQKSCVGYVKRILPLFHAVVKFCSTV